MGCLGGCVGCVGVGRVSGLWQGVGWASGAWAWAECWVCGRVWVRRACGVGQSAGFVAGREVGIRCVGMGRALGLWQGVSVSGTWA